MKKSVRKSYCRRIKKDRDVSNAVRVGRNSVFGSAKDALLNANLFVSSAANGLSLLLETTRCKATLRFWRLEYRKNKRGEIAEIAAR